MARKLTPLGKNAQYWKTRGVIAQMSSDSNLESYKAETKKIFDEANDRINGKLKDLYVQFANEEGVSLDKAKKLLNSDELKNFKMSLSDYVELGKEQNNHYSAEINKKLKEASLKYRVTRLEAIQYQLQLESNKLYKELDQHFSDWNKDEFRERYYRQLFDVFQKAGIGTSFAKINDKELEEILKKPWNGNRNFSQRLWEHKNDLIDKLQNSLAQSLINGYSYTQSSKELAKQLHTKNYNAARLITTESSFFDTRGQQKALEELGVERYQNVAVLDNETCPICRGMDLKTFKVSAMKIGKNAPPYHPNCRDTIVPYYNDKKLKSYVEGSRAARDNANGETYYVPANMKYDTWAKDFGIKDKDGNYIVEPDYEVFDDNGKSLYLGNFQKGLSKQHYNWMKQTEKNASDEYRKAFNYAMPETNIGYLTPKEEREGNASYYYNGNIRFRKNYVSSDEFKGTAHHESTHAIDNLAYKKLKNKTSNVGGAYHYSSLTYQDNLLAKTLNQEFDENVKKFKDEDFNTQTLAIEDILRNLDKKKQLTDKEYDDLSWDIALALDDNNGDWSTLAKQVKNFKPEYSEDRKALIKMGLISENEVSDLERIQKLLPKDVTIRKIANRYNGKIYEDYFNTEKSADKALENYARYLRDKYKDEDLADLSDMFQAYTENVGYRKHFDISRNINGWGHERYYFAHGRSQPIEFFAEHHAANLNNPKSLKVIKEVLPKSEKISNDIMKAIANKEAHKFSGFGGNEFADFEIIEDEDDLPVDITLEYDDYGDIVDAEVIEDIDGHYNVEDLSGKELKKYNLDKFKSVLPQHVINAIHKDLEKADSNFREAWNRHIGKINNVVSNTKELSGYNPQTDNINLMPNDIKQFGNELSIHEGIHAIDRMAGREHFDHDVYFSHAYENGLIQKSLNEAWLQKVKNVFLDTVDRSDIINDLNKLDSMDMFSSLMNTKLSADDTEFITDMMDEGYSFKNLIETNQRAKNIFNNNYKDFEDVAFNNLNDKDKVIYLGFLKDDLLEKYGNGNDINSLSDAFQGFAERYARTPMNLNGFGHQPGYFLADSSNQAAEFVARYLSSVTSYPKAAQILSEEFPGVIGNINKAVELMAKGKVR